MASTSNLSTCSLVGFLASTLTACVDQGFVSELTEGGSGGSSTGAQASTGDTEATPTTAEPTTADDPTTGGDSTTGGLTATTTSAGDTTTGDDTTADDASTTGGTETTTGSDTTDGSDTTTTDSTTTGTDTSDTSDTETTTGDDTTDTGGPGDAVYAECFLAEAVPNLAVSFPSAEVAADFNGDGEVDIAVKSNSTILTPETSGVSVMLGLGGGKFTAETLNVTGHSLHSEYSLATADFDGDGDADLIDVSDQKDLVSVLFNKGDGSFAAPVTYANITLNPEVVVTGDFNGDGKPDAVIITAKSMAHVLLNQGNGTLTVGPAFATGALSSYWGYPTAVTDYDGDGKLDLAIAGHDSVSAQLLHGQGDGTFAAPVALPLKIQPSSINAADYDGDGKVDLAFGSGKYKYNPTSQVHVLRGQGNGTFAPAEVYEDSVFGDEVELTSADLNGDGHIDLVTISPVAKRLNTLMNQGDGTFAPGESLAVGEGPQRVITPDVDADGKADLLITAHDTFGVVVLLQNANGSFGKVAPFIVEGGGVYGLRLGDYNGDGEHDILDVGLGNLRLLLSEGGGKFKLTIDQPLGNVGSPVLTDFNGDSKLDLLTGGGPSVQVMLGAGDGTLAAPVEYAGSDNVSHMATADFDADGKLDLAIVDNFYFTLMRGTGNGALMEPEQVFGPTDPRELVVADMNGDSKPDLVVADMPNEDAVVRVLLGKGDGTFTSKTVLLPDNFLVKPLALDLDKDGDLDLAVGENHSKMHVLLNQGNGDMVFSAVYPLAVLSGWALVPADLNGDGAPDIVLHDVGNPLLSVSINQGNGLFFPAQSYETGANGPVAPRDMNGDGKLDLVIDGWHLSLMINKGNGTFLPAETYWQRSYQRTVGGDFDGDGLTDLVVGMNDGLHIMRSNCP